MKLADNIYSFRKANGLSQEKLAEKINVSRQTISNWELGETAPNPEQLILLSSVFEKSIDELVGKEIKSETKEVTKDNINKIKLIYVGLAVLGALTLGVWSATANRFQMWETFGITVAGAFIGAALAAVIHGFIKTKK
ncbi:MAG: helix-turn-helix transcriptional regulator [Clostridia bacterium]|nr:helix-turn-helix transcriptional regulator [Clostridia bacterium]